MSKSVLAPTVWKDEEIHVFKECVRLGGLNKDLVKLALPTRSIEEISIAFKFLKESLATTLKANQLLACDTTEELHFALQCLWDLTKSLNEAKTFLYPLISRSIENQLIQLLNRYRNDRKKGIPRREKKVAVNSIPKSLQIQLIPKNSSTEMALNTMGFKSKLQLTVGKNKKISSVVDHLHKKWKTALSNMYIRLSSPLRGTSTWDKEDKTVSAGSIYSLLSASDALFQLDYEFLPIGSEMEVNNIDQLSFTPSQEAHFVNVLEDLENVQPNFVELDSTSLVSQIPGFEESTLSTSAIRPPTPKIEEDANTFPAFPVPQVPETSSSFELLQQTLPTTPYKVHKTGYLEATSNDGFSPMTRTRKYAGKCQEYWGQFDESVDYSHFYAGKRKTRDAWQIQPEKKKQMLVVHL